MTITPSYVQQADVPKCCRAMVKVFWRIFGRKFLTEKPGPLNDVLDFKTEDLASAVVYLTSVFSPQEWIGVAYVVSGSRYCAVNCSIPSSGFLCPSTIRPQALYTQTLIDHLI